MQPNAKRLAFTVALTYVIVAGGWIISSDWCLNKFVNDPEAILFIDVIKDAVFAVLTAGLLYLILRRSLKHWEQEAEKRLVAEAARQESENRYRQLFEAETDALVVVDLQSAQILDANPAAELLYGHAREELLRLKATDLSAEPEKTGNAIAQHEKHIPLRLHRRKDGTVFPVEISCSEYVQANRMVHVAAIRDITQRQRVQEALVESEQNLRDLFENMNEGFAHCRMIFEAGQPKDFVYLAVNKMFCEISGLSDVLGKRINELVPGIYERDREAFEIYGRVAATGRPEKFERFNQTLQQWLGVSVYSTQLNYFVVLMEVITERKQTELAQKLSDASINFSSLAKFWISRDARIVRVNPAACAQLGYTEAELLQMAITELDPDFPAARWPEHWQELRAKKHLTFETQHRHKDGHLIPVEVSLNWFEFAGQEYNFAYAKDITERKQADLALQESECLLRLVMDLVPHFVFVKDGQGRYLLMNAACAAANGMTPEEMIGLNDREWLPDRSQVEAFNRDDQEVIASGRTKFIPEECLTDAAGKTRILQTTKIPFTVPSTGERAVMGVAVDITELKLAETALQRSESRLNFALQTSGIGAWELNLKTRETIRTQIHSRIFGYETMLPQWSFEIFLEHILPEDRPEVQRRFREAATNASDFNFECRIRRHDGAIRWIFAAGGHELNVAGEPERVSGIVQDITERKWAEVALKQKDVFKQSILDSVSAHIAVLDSRGVIQSVNSRWLDFARENPVRAGELPRNVGVGVNYLEVCRQGNGDAGEGAMTAHDGIVAVLEGRAPTFTHEYRCDSPDEQRWFLMSVTKMEMDDEFVVVSHTNITKRKEVEEALRSSEERLRFVTENARVGLVVVNQDRRYTFANAAYSEILDLPSPDILGLRVADVLGPLYEEQIRPRLDSAFAGERVSYELHKPLRGEDRFYTVTYEPNRTDGPVSAVVVVITDITKRKQAEDKMARLATAVDHAAEAIVITDIDGTIQYVNPAFEKVAGYTSPEVIGKTPRILKSDKQDAEFYRRMWDTLKRGEIWSGRFVNRHKGGTLFEEEATISPIRDAAGKTINYVAVKRDVTRESQLEKQFHQAQKMEAIGTLAGGIAHDFNNILAAMFGYGYLLQSDCEGNASATESVGEILSAAARAKDLVQQILTFSRQRDQKRQIVRLNTVVKEALKFMRASLPAGIKIETELQDSTPPVLADPSQIYQIVLNLATNAFHALEGKRGSLTVSLTAFTADASFRRRHPEITSDEWVQLTVADTGHGMKPEVLEHIFEPFFTTKPVGKGTGLGLSVVHGIIQSHDGIIEVDSELGTGTSFKIYFPARPEEQPASVTESHSLPRGNDQQILVVDDEAAITAVFQKLLTRLNYRVTTANSPLSALEIFSREPQAFALIITDLTMPDMGGLELAAKIRESDPRVPIVLVSGQAAAVNPAQIAQCGVSAMLEKPITNTALARVVNQFLAPQTR